MKNSIAAISLCLSVLLVGCSDSDSPKQQASAIAYQKAMKRPHLIDGAIACDSIKSMYKVSILKNQNPMALQYAFPYDCQYVPYNLEIKASQQTMYPEISQLIGKNTGNIFFSETSSVKMMVPKK